MSFMRIVLIALALSGGVFAQTVHAPVDAKPNVNDKPNIDGKAPLGQPALTNPGYVLGPGDQLTIRVVNLEEINDKPVSVDLSGYIRLPMVGRIQVSGLSVAEVETELTNRLKTYLLHPDVSVSVTEFRSQPVSVIGAVRTPGVHQVQGRKTLVEMLSLAGGLDTTAGSTLKITRRLEWGRIPLPRAADDPTGQFSVAEVSLKSILQAKNPEENILVKPYDVITVPKAEMVYVIGLVQKSGGIPLNDHEDITALQALSIAGGLDRMAQPKHARILRRMPGESSRTEIAVDLQKILDGKIADVRMQPEDILFVPNSVPKNAAIRALDSAIQMGTGVVIFRRP